MKINSYIHFNPPSPCWECGSSSYYEAYDYLNQGGNLTIVIQKNQMIRSAKAKMEDVFGNVEVSSVDKGYFYILRI